MKNTFILLVMLSQCSSMLKAQFASVGSKWHYGIINFQGAEDYFTYEIIKDTIIANETYSKIVYNDKMGLQSYSYLVIKDNSKTYYWNGAKKCLLFDSSKKSGDTLTIDAYYYLWNTKKDTTITLLIKIDSVLFSISNSLNTSDTLFTFSYRNIDNVVIAGYLNSGFYTESVIKNQSVNKWLLSTFEPITTGSSDIYIRCFNSANYNYKSMILSSKPCDFTNVGFTEIINVNDFKLYPNPNKGLFTLSFNDNTLRQVNIFDALGNLVSTFVSVEKEIHINLHDKAHGIYFFNVLSDKGQFNSRIVLE